MLWVVRGLQSYTPINAIWAVHHHDATGLECAADAIGALPIFSFARGAAFVELTFDLFDTDAQRGKALALDLFVKAIYRLCQQTEGLGDAAKSSQGAGDDRGASFSGFFVAGETVDGAGDLEQIAQRLCGVEIVVQGA